MSTATRTRDIKVPAIDLAIGTVFQTRGKGYTFRHRDGWNAGRIRLVCDEAVVLVDPRCVVDVAR